MATKKDKKKQAQPWRPATKLVHEGTLRSQFGETSEALFLTQGYVYESSAQAERRFKNEEPGYQYSRFANPTVAMLEARMAAMQAQVEPHFLFNTLASIDHLIETDPPRASQMQKHLIALLRASMPTLREASDGGTRDLGRELAVIRPYLEILKVRMEERLATDIDVPEGLLSAEFPPMMIQTLVENAIKDHAASAAKLEKVRADFPVSFPIDI